MNEARFNQYLEAFNTRNYEKLHNDFFAPTVKLYTAGHILDGQQAVKNFYGFYHSNIKESIKLEEFYPVADGHWAVLNMKLEAFNEVTKDMLIANNVGNLPPIPAGAVYETTLFVHYKTENDKFTVIRCAEFPFITE